MATPSFMTASASRAFPNFNWNTLRTTIMGTSIRRGLTPEPIMLRSSERHADEASGIETPTRADLRSEGEAEAFERRLDPSAGSRREEHQHEGWANSPARNAEHAVDLETGAVVGASEGDTTTSRETLIEAAEQIEAVRP